MSQPSRTVNRTLRLAETAAAAPPRRSASLEQVAFDACAQDTAALAAVLERWRTYLSRLESTDPGGRPSPHPFRLATTRRVLPGAYLDADLSSFVLDATDTVVYIGLPWCGYTVVDADLVRARALWRFAARLVQHDFSHPWPQRTVGEIAMALGALCDVTLDEALLAAWRTAESELQARVTGRPVAEIAAVLEHVHRLRGSTGSSSSSSSSDTPEPQARALVQEVAALRAAIDAERRAHLETRRQQQLQEIALHRENRRLAEAARAAERTRDLAEHAAAELRSGSTWMLVRQHERRLEAALRLQRRWRRLCASTGRSLRHLATYGPIHYLGVVRSKLATRETVVVPAPAAPPALPAPIDVIVPVYNAAPLFKRCVESVLASTSPGTYRLIVIDDASSDPAVGEYLDYLEGRRLPHVVVLRNTENVGFIKTVNRGVSLSTHDVVLLNSDTVVTPGWLAGLAAAARSDEWVATVTPVSNNASICSVPRFFEPSELPEGHDAASFAHVVTAAAAVLGQWHIEIPTAIGFCMFIKRAALEDLGLFDEAYGHGYNEENDFCMRAHLRGYRHLAALGVFVYHQGRGSFQDERDTLETANLRRLVERYPCYHDVVGEFVRANPLRDYLAAFPDALAAAARPNAVAIGIDAQVLWRQQPTGTERSIAKLVEEIPRGDVSGHGYHVYGPPADVGVRASVRPHYAEDVDDVLIDSARLDLFHRPYQCFSPLDLLLLLKAEASVITVLDLICCHYPAYFPSRADHGRYVDMMRLSVRMADRVIAISEHGRQDLVATFGVPEDKIDVVHLGPSGLVCADRESGQPWPYPNLRRGRYLLYSGTNYEHKNHERLIAAFRKLIRGRRGDLKLVLAGASISPARTREVQSLFADLQGRVVDLGYVDDRQLSRLYAGAAAYVLPSLYEGFGMTVLEAMAHGTPVVAARATSIPEVVGDAALLVDALDVDDLCRGMAQVLDDRRLRQALIARGYERARRFSWEDCARRTAQTYEKALADARARGPRRLPEDVRNELWSLVGPIERPALRRVVESLIGRPPS